ncbi:glycoside hydrolase family 10 protein [Armillaria fumosa]|nr:glycoside hydrolase family 10 protein [Armillaria fumosa]
MLFTIISLAAIFQCAATVLASTALSGLNTKFTAEGKLFWKSLAANEAILESEFGALPSWVSDITDADTLTSVIQMHIANVAGKYSGKLYGCSPLSNVLSRKFEVLNEDGTLRSGVFYNVLGESFITIAFKAARTADPTAKLYINDYNLDSNNTKAQGMVALVKRINADEQLIDGIGTQMHLSAGGSSGVAAALTTLAGAGTDVAIIELDITGASTSDYTTVVDACLSNTACVSITSWGVSDVNSWRASSTPLLFDSSYQPKDAYTAVISDLSDSGPKAFVPGWSLFFINLPPSYHDLVTGLESLFRSQLYTHV